MAASVVTVEPASPLVVEYARDGGDTIDQRDLMFDNGTYAKRASDQADTATPATNYSNFATAFAGLAVGGAIAEQTDDGEIAVQRDGVAEHPCDATDWAVGDLVGAVENAAGTALENQKVRKTTQANEAIGRCVKAGSQLTRVKWILQPKSLQPAT